MSTIKKYALWAWELVKRGLILNLLLLDCFGNVLAGGSFKNTLSGESWHHREHKYWGWCHRAIDKVFGANHCQKAAIRETENGGAWRGWWAKTKRVATTGK